MQYMPAVLLAHAKELRDDGSIIEIVIWELPNRCRRVLTGTRTACSTAQPDPAGSGTTTNTSKGDHRHIAEREEDYVFTTLEQLLEDFRFDVEGWR